MSLDEESEEPEISSPKSKLEDKENSLSANLKRFSIVISICLFALYKGSSCEGEPYPKSPFETVSEYCEDVANRVRSMFSDN